MKVLVCHNFHQRPGGEDDVFAAGIILLESHDIRITSDGGLLACGEFDDALGLMGMATVLDGK